MGSYLRKMRRERDRRRGTFQPGRGSLPNRGLTSLLGARSRGSNAKVELPAIADPVSMPILLALAGVLRGRIGRQSPYKLRTRKSA